MPSRQVHLQLPIGTKVLVHSDGRVGIVTANNHLHSTEYQVRFADGKVGGFSRDELAIFKHADAEIPGTPDISSLSRFVASRCVVGSRAFGLDHADSDTDRRGFYLPPADLHWGLAGVPEQLESDNEECYWEIEKFIRLALKANPNILECLYSPMVEKCTPLARELIDLREIFLSRHVHRTYNSYVLSQFKKLEQDVRNRHEVRWKHVMHLIRLLLSGIEVLERGLVPLRMDAHRDQLLAIRSGAIPWEVVNQWRLELHSELDRSFERSSLPEHPDYARANAFLLRARRYAAMPEYLEECP